MYVQLSIIAFTIDDDHEVSGFVFRVPGFMLGVPHIPYPFKLETRKHKPETINIKSYLYKNL